MCEALAGLTIVGAHCEIKARRRHLFPVIGEIEVSDHLRAEAGRQFYLTAHLLTEFVHEFVPICHS